MDRQYFYCFKVFLVFVCMMYVPGLFYYPFFYEGYVSYFNYGGGLYNHFFLILTIFVFLTFISFLAVGKIPYLKVRTLNSQIVFYLVVIIIVLFFVLSLYFFMNFTASFRHKNRLADAGNLIALLFFMKPMIYFFVALMLIHVLNGFRLGRYSRYLLFVILISTVLFLNSSLQFVIIPVILVMLYFPKLLVMNFRTLNFKYLFIILISAPLVCFVVIIVGVGNKLGFDFILTKDGFDYLIGFGNVLFPRMSTSLFSSVIMLDKFIGGVNYTDEVLNGIQLTIENRFALFFPNDRFDSDLINTVSRLNYLEVFKSHADRAGASPGIISSVFYVPFFPATFIFIPLYVAIIFRALRYHMHVNVKMNLLSMMILPYLIISLFEAPLNIFYLLDPVLILFFIVVFLGRFINIDTIFSK